MLAALGSPVRSPLHRQPRSAPASPFPLGNLRPLSTFNLNLNLAGNNQPLTPTASSPSASSAFATPTAGPAPPPHQAYGPLSPNRLFFLAPLEEEEQPAGLLHDARALPPLDFQFAPILAPAPAAPLMHAAAAAAAVHQEPRHEEQGDEEADDAADAHDAAAAMAAAAVGEGPIAAAMAVGGLHAGLAGHGAAAAALAAALQWGVLPDPGDPLAALAPLPAAAAPVAPPAVLPEVPQLQNQPAPVPPPPPAAAAAVPAAAAGINQAAAAVPAAAAAAAPAPAPAPATRKRCPEKDLEPGVWELLPPAGEVGAEGQVAGPAEGAAETKLSEPVMVFLRSLTSSSRTRITFANDSDRTVVAYWVDYNGQEVPYGSLKPKQAKIYDTYVSHPWIFRCADTGDRMVVDGRMVHYAAPPRPAPSEDSLSLALGRPPARREPRVVISEAPALQHSRTTHAAFPADYRAACRALLLAHQRRRRPDLAAAAATAAAARATVAEVMCRLVRNAVTSVMAAAQPMLAMSVCTPAPPASSSSSSSASPDTCARVVGRWLDGSALTVPEPGSGSGSGSEEERFEDASSNDGGAEREEAAAAATAAAAAASGSQGGAAMCAPGQVRMSPAQLAAAAQQRKGSEPRRDVRSEIAAAGVGSGAAPRELGDLLAELPLDLVHHIIHLMAPPLRQHVALHPCGHPDILPALLPSDPATWSRPAAPGEQAAVNNA